MGAKLMKVFARRYFIYGIILSLISFFAVPKGDTDMRLVHNITSSGLNAHLWAPWLCHSVAIKTITIHVYRGSYFHNYYNNLLI
jgi:hypothetical protein